MLSDYDTTQLNTVIVHLERIKKKVDTNTIYEFDLEIFQACITELRNIRERNS
jgi:hypothetical protein